MQANFNGTFCLSARSEGLPSRRLPETGRGTGLCPSRVYALFSGYRVEEIVPLRRRLQHRLQGQILALAEHRQLHGVPRTAAGLC